MPLTGQKEARGGLGTVMPVYKAPVDEITFLLSDVFHLDRYNNLPGFAEATSDVVEAVHMAGISKKVAKLRPIGVIKG